MAESRKAWWVALLEVAGALAVTAAADPTIRRNLRPLYWHTVMRVCQRLAGRFGAAGLRAEAAYRRTVGR